MVKIIGGGPAGLSCALMLAMEGIPCEVYEKKKRTGIPVNCAELTRKETLKILKIDFPNDIIQREYDCFVLLHKDMWLKYLALECMNRGVDIIHSEYTAWGVQADMRVIATGMNPAIHYGDKVLACYGGRVTGQLPDHGIVMDREWHTAPWFNYMWQFPFSGGANVGICVFGKRMHEAIKLFKELIAEYPNISVERTDTGYTPCTLPERRCYSHNHISIGACSGLVNALYGEGIHYAVVSGIVAAAAIKHCNGKYTEQNLSFYDKYMKSIHIELEQKYEKYLTKCPSDDII